MKNALVATIMANLKNADQSQIEAAIAKAKAEEIASFLDENLRPVVDVAYPRLFGLNASKSHNAFGPFVEASAMLIAGKMIADAIHESNAKTLTALEEIGAAVVAAS
jgi:hypothetical protein